MFGAKTNKVAQDTTPVPDWAAQHPAWLRLRDQIQWYDSTGGRCQFLYKTLKFGQVALALLIPLLSHLPSESSKWATGVAGALIALLEAVQHMNQYSTLWVMYRSTTEHLKHEKYLFLSTAGAYRGLSNADRLVLLAERVEERVSAEHANWFSEARRGAEKKD